jgi:hypothetical protein
LRKFLRRLKTVNSPRKFHRKISKLKIFNSRVAENSVSARVEMRNELTSSMAGSNLGQSEDGSNVVTSREEYLR